MKVLLKHKIPKQGEYNADIYDCLECDFKSTVLDFAGHSKYAVGWFYDDDWFMVWECPKCFTKWYHHDRDLFYYRHERIKEELSN